MNLEKINYKKLLIFVLVLTTILRLYRLDYPTKYMFDEVYHAFTAKEYFLGHKQAWEWWNTPPSDVAYEWTHPPLAKEVMAVSMVIFRSTDSWAWRLPGALLGILSIYIIYLLGVELFKNRRIALLAAFLFSIDGLNFVQSRIGMNDIYMVTFMLVAVWLTLRKKYFFSAVMAGLSLASKWSALYLLIMLIILFLRQKAYKKIPYLILIPVLIYLISYIPFFLTGHNFNQFVELQQQMWWYHTGLKAHHPYASPWWSWPLNLYPVWYYVEYFKGTTANIFGSGNPALFWAGTITLLISLFEFAKKRSSALLVILLGFSVFWLPWVLSPRIMFLYHFSPSVPFLCLNLAYQLDIGFQHSDSRKMTLLIILSIVLSFILIYPFLTGIPLPKNIVNLFFFTNLTKNPFSP